MNKSGLKATAAALSAMYLAVLVVWGKRLQEWLGTAKYPSDMIVLLPIILAGSIHFWFGAYDYFKKREPSKD